MNKKLSLFMKEFKSIELLKKEIVSFWPEHLNFIEKSLLTHNASEMSLLNGIADDILLLIGDNRAEWYKSYKWMCDEFSKEQLEFYRTGSYRRNSFKEAYEEVYSNPFIMKNYMRGLLISSIFWANHASSYTYFIRSFLTRLPDNFNYLEIGPGHGLFLTLAAREKLCNSITALDVSEDSIKETRNASNVLGIKKPINIILGDIQRIAKISSKKYEAIVISEVLEHLEEPIQALRNLKTSLTFNGKLFVNVPINSPAPDHIFLLSSIEEARKMIIDSGLKIIDSKELPMSGYDLQRAIKLNATINCLFIYSLDIHE